MGALEELYELKFGTKVGINKWNICTKFHLSWTFGDKLKFSQNVVS